ncbi:MAG: potassium/proton antiporter [Bacteroidales bacterium]|nr:potassium/proton antiporter [Bacteroidales bacterium]
MITLILLIGALVLFISIGLNNISTRLGIPALLAFLLLGAIFGVTDVIPVKIEDFKFAHNFCTCALIFIMFYGGFGTRWSAVRHIVTEAGLLASVGVIITAAVTSLLCYFVLGWELIGSLVMGAIVSSTDAASVFSILRTKKLGLKNNTSPMLQVESGSNDPMAYMLTIAMLSIANGTASGGKLALMLLMQIGIGTVCGLILAQIACLTLRKVDIKGSGYISLFILALAVASYSIPDILGGNGYLSVYLVGMIVGNQDFKDKKTIVNFFDGITELMQVMTFFLIGLLVDLSKMPNDIIPAILIFLFLLLLARPAAVFGVLTPFRKYNFKQMAFISFVGLRGASAIVFAIMCINGDEPMQQDLFNIVFFLVVISIGLQGSLIPWAAKKLDMIDKHSNVLKSFNDYTEDNTLHFSWVEVTPESSMANKQVHEINFPKNVLIALIIRGKEQIIARGDTTLLPGDKAILVTKAFEGSDAIFLEKTVKPTSRRIGKKIKEVPGSGIIILIRRGDENIIPNGNTVLYEGDHLVLLR